MRGGAEPNPVLRPVHAARRWVVLGLLGFFAVLVLGRAFQLQVLTVTDKGVSHVGCFFDTALFEEFGLPEVIARDTAR